MTRATHDIRFPRESGEYRAARNELLQAEAELRDKLEAVAALRRKLPLGGPAEDYVFDELVNGDVRQVKLSELFENGKDSLILYSFMYGPEMEKPCPLCNSFLDGLDGYAPHITQRVNLAVVAKSPIDRTEQWAGLRGWNNLRLLSSNRNSYHADYFNEGPDGSQWPVCHVFVKTDEGVRHFWASELLYAPSEGHARHIDSLWPIWSFFDLTPEGRGKTWLPKLRY